MDEKTRTLCYSDVFIQLLCDVDKVPAAEKDVINQNKFLDIILVYSQTQ